MNTHRIQIPPVTRDLPILEVAPGVHLAIFNLLGDWELTEAAGKALAPLVPSSTEVLLMPGGKAEALLHVLGRETGLPTVVARKEYKTYMGQPRSYTYRSITTQKTQTLYLGESDAAKVAGKNVSVVDDVVSTGGTLQCCQHLVLTCGGFMDAVLAVFTEGEAKPHVRCLGHLPSF